MKKTIGAMALLAASTSAYAIMPPGHNLPDPHKACIKLYSGENQEVDASDCDSTRNNKKLKLELLDNGCPAGQASFVSYSVKLPECMPVGVIQL